jgi:hypothetical protein
MTSQSSLQDFALPGAMYALEGRNGNEGVGFCLDMGSQKEFNLK